MLKTKEEIKAWLDNYRVEDYTINDDLTVDVNVNGNVYLGGVNLSGYGLKEIPIQFGLVNGTFECNDNELTSCAGFPVKLNASLYCYNNKITSLFGCPKIVVDFNCSENQLTSLVGGPEKVGGTYNCAENNLTSLIGSPEEISDDFCCGHNKIESLNNSPKYVGKSFIAYDNPIKTLNGFSCDFGEYFVHSGEVGELIPDFEDLYQDIYDNGNLFLHISHKDLLILFHKLELMKELSELKCNESILPNKKPKI